MKPVHILLVEDNEGDIFLTMEAFEESKILTNISLARNGQEALEFLRKEGKHTDAERPDLIILDINIPIFNGHEVLKIVKNDNELKRIPVIILTTSSDTEDIHRAYEEHANCYVTKEIEIESFLKAVLKIENFWLQLCTLPNN